MDYAGLNVLSVENELSENVTIVAVGVALLCCSIVSLITIDMNKTNFTKIFQHRFWIICSIGVVGIVMIWIGMMKSYPTGQIIITATIDDGVSFSDISRQYEVMSVDNNIFTLKKKNFYDTYHCVCEQCGKEIESGPPWLCKECKK